MADMKQQGMEIELGRQRFGGAADLALQQTEMVSLATAVTPIVWQMGTVWGTVTAEFATDQPRYFIQ